MKKFIAIFMFTVVLLGSVTGVTYANEEIDEVRRIKPIQRFVNAFDDVEHATVVDIKEAIKDKKEVRAENTELREQLKDMLNGVKEDGIQLDEHTKEIINNAKEKLQNSEGVKFSLEDFNFRIKESLENSDVFNKITARILNGTDNLEQKLEKRGDILENLMDIIMEDIED